MRKTTCYVQGSPHKAISRSLFVKKTRGNMCCQACGDEEIFVNSRNINWLSPMENSMVVP